MSSISPTSNATMSVALTANEPAAEAPTATSSLAKPHRIRRSSAASSLAPSLSLAPAAIPSRLQPLARLLPPRALTHCAMPRQRATCRRVASLATPRRATFLRRRQAPLPLRRPRRTHLYGGAPRHRLAKLSLLRSRPSPLSLASREHSRSSPRTATLFSTLSSRALRWALMAEHDARRAAFSQSQLRPPRLSSASTPSQSSTLLVGLRLRLTHHSWPQLRRPWRQQSPLLRTTPSPLQLSRACRSLSCCLSRTGPPSARRLEACRVSAFLEEHA